MSFFTDPPLHDFPDRAIRLLLEHPAHLQQLVSAVAPHLAPGFDFARTVLLNRTFPMPDWRRREADLLFHVPYRAGEVEEAALVCILLEHQSAPDPSVPLRTLLYAVLYWERQWRHWEERHRRGDPLRLNLVLPIVFYTGPDPWPTNRTLADLLALPEPFRSSVPRWEPVFWNLAEQSPEALLSAPGEWLHALAVVRSEREPPEAFWGVFAEVTRRLEPLSAQDRVRWQDLMWFLLSWALRRRPGAERDRVAATATAAIANVAVQEEVRAMSQTIGQTWEQEMLARGELRAWRESLRTYLEGRFGTLPEEVVQRIQATEDLDRLRACMRQVAQLTSLDQLQL
jgi:hypothetical protein